MLILIILRRLATKRWKKCCQSAVISFPSRYLKSSRTMKKVYNNFRSDVKICLSWKKLCHSFIRNWKIIVFQYDAFGHSGEGGGHNPFGDFTGGGAWNFRSSIDPEELFKTIFGDKSWRSGGMGSADQHFDFGAPIEYQVSLLVFSVVSVLYFYSVFPLKYLLDYVVEVAIFTAILSQLIICFGFSTLKE